MNQQELPPLRVLVSLMLYQKQLKRSRDFEIDILLLMFVTYIDCTSYTFVSGFHLNPPDEKMYWTLCSTIFYKGTRVKLRDYRIFYMKYKFLNVIIAQTHPPSSLLLLDSFLYIVLIIEPRKGSRVWICEKIQSFYRMTRLFSLVTLDDGHSSS